jgi:uncharacterized protein YacL
MTHDTEDLGMTEAVEEPVDMGPRPRLPEPPSVVAERERRSQRMMLLVARLLFLVLLVTVTLLTIASTAQRPEEFEVTTLIGLFIGATAVGIIILLLDAMTPNKRLSSVVGVYLGVCVGLIGALAIGALLDVVTEAWELNTGPIGLYLGLSKFVIALVLCYLSVSVVLTTKDDFRLVIPYVEFSKQQRGVRPLLIDTSVLIDGRLDSLGNTGFLDAPLVVPQFVIDELQTLADSGDRLKRARGRRGLGLVSKLQGNPYLDVTIDTAEAPGHSVDHKLLHLASQQNLRILTNTLKSQAVPGETLVVEVVRRGEAAEQGVGYLPDGTMVVIEGAAERVGQTVTLTVTNSLQTTAGRMIFGKVDGAGVAAAGPMDEDGDVEQLAHSATHQARSTARPTKTTRAGSSSPRNPRRGKP